MIGEGNKPLEKDLFVPNKKYTFGFYEWLNTLGERVTQRILAGATTYTVPAGKTFFLTFLGGNYNNASGQNVYVYINSFSRQTTLFDIYDTAVGIFSQPYNPLPIKLNSSEGITIGGSGQGTAWIVGFLVDNKVVTEYL